MKTMIRFSFWVVIMAIAPMVCMAQKSGDQSNGIRLKVKSGNIAYKVTTQGGKEQVANFIFDDFGNYFRIEMNGECSIADAVANKAYRLYSGTKTYVEEDPAAVFRALSFFLHTGDNNIAKDYQGFKKLPNQTIADKDCVVFSFTNESRTITVARWKGLLFSKETPKESFVATSFSETIPENSFTVPADYKLVKN